MKWTAAILAILLVLPAFADADSTIHLSVIDASVHHQTIDNFAASDCWSIQKIGGWALANKQKVADLLFSMDKGIGLSCWRFNVGGGINHETISTDWRTAETFEIAKGQYDWTRQANEQWFLHAAKERGVEHFVAFVNSPPGRMTRTGFTNSADDKTSSTNLKSGFEGQYARYLADIILHFRDLPDSAQRIFFDYVSPVNEPQGGWNGGKQEGNRASNEDIERIVAALHQELIRRQLGTRIIAPESNSLQGMWQLHQGDTKKFGTPFGDYIDVFCGNPKVASTVDGILCYHDYSAASGRHLAPDHLKLGQKLAAYPGWKIWMSEICIMEPKRDLGMKSALTMARLIHADLALANASAWQWWLAVSPYDFKDGLLYTDWKKPGDPETIIESKMLWVLGNFSRFIRPGMQRIDVQTDNESFSGLLGSAYEDPASHHLVIVYINSQDKPQTVHLQMKEGSRSDTYIPYVTSEQGNLVAQPAQQIPGDIEIPALSVVTLIRREDLKSHP